MEVLGKGCVGSVAVSFRDAASRGRGAGTINAEICFLSVRDATGNGEEGLL